MRTSETDFVLVPGTSPNGQHWIARWWRNLKTARLLPPPPGSGLPEAWRASLIDAVRVAERPCVVIAHGRGATLAASCAEALADAGLVGMLLVAPHDLPELNGGTAHHVADQPAPDLQFRFPSMLIAPRNSPHLSFERAHDLAQAFGAQLVDAGDTGPIDETSGHGPWPEGLLRLGRFLKGIGATTLQ